MENCTKKLLKDYFEGFGDAKTAREISDGTSGVFPEKKMQKVNLQGISGEFPRKGTVNFW